MSEGVKAAPKVCMPCRFGTMAWEATGIGEAVAKCWLVTNWWKPKKKRETTNGCGCRADSFNLPSLLNVFSLRISSSLHLFSTLRQYGMDFDKALWLQTTWAEHLLPPHPDQRQRPPRAEQHGHTDCARVQLRWWRHGDVLQRRDLRPPRQPEQRSTHCNPRLHLCPAR